MTMKGELQGLWRGIREIWDRRRYGEPDPELILGETMEHPRFGAIHIGGTTTGRHFWGIWGDRIPEVRIHASGSRYNGMPGLKEPYGFDNTEITVLMLQYAGQEYKVQQPFVMVPSRKNLAFQAELPGRKYVYRAKGKGAEVERVGHGVVLARATRKDEDKGQLTELADPLDASVALLLERSIAATFLVLLR